VNFLILKQEALAQALGTNQQAISAIENSEMVEEEKLKAIAEVLGVSIEEIKNFSEEVVLNIIGNTYSDNGIVNAGLNYNCSFNPLDKIIELYEHLVLAEKEKVEYLEKLLRRENFF
jgi:transcriptional regulator with XRE-family HTH domain